MAMSDLAEARRRKASANASEPVQPDAATFPHVKITNDSVFGFRTKIYVDGKDISAWCQRAEVVYHYKNVNVVRLDIVAGTLEVESDAALKLSTDAEALLIKNGWTPPVGGSGT